MIYTPELRKEICLRRQSGDQGVALSEEYNIPLTTIYRWSTPGASERHRKNNREKYQTDTNYARKVRQRIKEQQKNRYHNDTDYRLQKLIDGLHRKAKERDHSSCKVTVKELKLSWTGQCHCCGECEKSDNSLCIDHCHITGKFRGWLCRNCNLALGLCQDNPNILVKYLYQVT